MTPARILIVEDDRIVARDLGQQLTMMGHTVVGMTSRGEEAAAKAQDLCADLVLMDIRLEGRTDGVAAAQEVRDRCHIPVVYLTAYADEATVSRASHTEPFGYLLKPFEDLQLMTVIEMALHKHAAERKLHASERRYATTLSSIADGVISTDENAAIIFMNPAAEAITGWRQQDAIGRTIAEVFKATWNVTGEPLQCPAIEALRSGLGVRLPPGAMLLTRTGRKVPIDGNGSPVLAENGRIMGAVLAVSDITQRLETEETLRQAQSDLAHASRLTTLGELAASIAHEVNQPLMAAVTNAEACIRWLSGSRPNLPQAEKAAGRVVCNGHRAAEVIMSIRAMAGNTSLTKDRVDLGAAIDDVLKLMRGDLHRAGVTLNTHVHPGLPAVVGNRVQIQQVIMNLLLNAKDAAAGMQADASISVAAMPDGAWVTVTVEDSGPGILPENQARIFEPLFTTKPGGLGLGLSICRSIIEAHRGQLWLSPRSRSGSLFQFTLPRGDEA